jgi:hypothetical protein
MTAGATRNANPVLKWTRYEFLDSRSRNFSAALGAAVGVQDRTECLDCIAMRSVVDVHASAFGLDQSGPPELGQVVAHSVSPRAAARSPLFSSPDEELNRYDMIFTRAGSASALSRSATCRASSSLIGPAATGASTPVPRRLRHSASIQVTRLESCE